MEYLGDDDLEYKEERELDVKPTVVIKKNIPLKIKSINLSSSTTQSSTSSKQAVTSGTSSNVVNVNVIDHTNASRPIIETTKETTLSVTNTSSNNSSLSPPIAKIKKIDHIDESDIFSPTTSNCSISPGKNSSLTQEKYTENRKNHLVNNLNWNMNVNVISQKISDQRMDYCMLCCLPILIYARFIPCKHVTCIQCATNNGLNICLKDGCITQVERIEKVTRGNIFVCTYESDEHETNPDMLRLQPETSQKNHCGRSYLSQRDLEAHIKHRHEPATYQPNPA